MAKRKIIGIDESLCNGCGNCVTGCTLGAIEMVNNIARLKGDIYCDGLGACIGICPSGALKIEEREANDFKRALEDVHPSKIREITKEERTKKDTSQACPGHRTVKLDNSLQLKNWPIQIVLAHPDTPYFKGARLLIAADCTAFAAPNLSDIIRKNIVLIGCPKLDDTEMFIQKLAEILRKNDILQITVAKMQVPCCSYLAKIVEEAQKRAGKSIPTDIITVMIEGDICPR